MLLQLILEPRNTGSRYRDSNSSRLAVYTEDAGVMYELLKSASCLQIVLIHWGSESPIDSGSIRRDLYASNLRNCSRQCSISRRWRTANKRTVGLKIKWRHTTNFNLLLWSINAHGYVDKHSTRTDLEPSHNSTFLRTAPNNGTRLVGCDKYSPIHQDKKVWQKSYRSGKCPFRYIVNRPTTNTMGTVIFSWFFYTLR